MGYGENPYTSKDVRDWLKYLFPGELKALKELARLLPPSPIVVNIGAGGGTSGLAFMESRPDLRLVTIDIQDESSPFGCLEAERDVITKAGLDSPRHRQILGDSVEVAARWDGGKVNMVFVDGNHSFEGCKGDLLGWIPHIEKGGLLLVHDYGKEKVYKREDLPEGLPHPRPWPGVDKAVDSLLVGRFPMVKIVDTLIVFRIE